MLLSLEVKYVLVDDLVDFIVVYVDLIIVIEINKVVVFFRNIFYDLWFFYERVCYLLFFI